LCKKEFYAFNFALILRQFPGKAVKIRLDQGGAEPLDLQFGEAEGASDGLDAWDEVAGTPPETGVTACFVNDKVADPGRRLLTRDVRLPAETTRWRFLTSSAAAGRGPVTLTWNVDAAAPERQVYMQRLLEETPVGRPIDMRTQQELLLTGEDAEWEIVYSLPMQTTLSLAAGWNLVGSPVMSVQSTDDILDDGTRASVALGSVWYWTDSGYGEWAGTEPLSPERGYWIFCPEGGQSAPITGIRADGIVSLRPGWNLVSPTADCVLPAVEGVTGPTWFWDSGTYRAVDAGGTLEAGHGYWLYLRADDAVHLVSLFLLPCHLAVGLPDVEPVLLERVGVVHPWFREHDVPAQFEFAEVRRRVAEPLHRGPDGDGVRGEAWRPAEHHLLLDPRYLGGAAAVDHAARRCADRRRNVVVREGDSTGRKPVEGRLAEPFRPDRLEHPLIAGDEEDVAHSLVRRVGVDRARQRRQPP